MPTSTTPSLSGLAPELVPHGVDIQIAARVGHTGTSVAIGEIYEMDYDEDWGMVQLPTLGTNIVGERQGRFHITGTIKSYWINASMRQMVLGVTPDGAGNPTPVYHSQRPFQRFDIVVTARITGSPVMTFFNVTFGKDATRWTENSFAEETITFAAEDLLAQ